MDTVGPKKKGRPATGRDPLVTIRLTPELLERIARWREGYPTLTTVSETVRVLIGLGLKIPEKKRFYVHDPKATERDSRRASEGKDKRTGLHSLKRLAPPVKPPPLVEAKPYRPKRASRVMSPADVAAALERAEAGRKR